MKKIDEILLRHIDCRCEKCRERMEIVSWDITDIYLRCPVCKKIITIALAIETSRENYDLTIKRQTYRH